MSDNIKIIEEALDSCILTQETLLPQGGGAIKARKAKVALRSLIDRNVLIGELEGMKKPLQEPRPEIQGWDKEAMLHNLLIDQIITKLREGTL